MEISANKIYEVEYLGLKVSVKLLNLKAIISKTNG